jgi:type VI secretion system protein ImpC
MKSNENKEGEFVGLKILEEIRLKSPQKKGIEVEKKAFVVGVLGDFGGSATTPSTKGKQKFKEMNRDNFDDVMAAMKPCCTVEVNNFIQKDGPPFQLSLDFQSLDEFHPDSLVHKVSLLRKLFEARKSVSDPDRVEKILREVGVAIEAEEPSPGAARAPEPGTPEEKSRKPLTPGLSPSELLDAIIEQSPPDTEKAVLRRLSTDLAKFVGEIVAPVADTTDYAAQDRARAKIDEIIGVQVRAILHHPSFQELEAAWRSLFRLVAKTETGPDLKIKVLDLSKETLLKHLSEQEKVERTLPYQLIYENECATPGGEPFGVLIGNYRFGPGPGDMLVLEYLAGIAFIADIPFITAASPSLLGLEDFSLLVDLDTLDHLKEGEQFSAWREFRQSDFAVRVGMCLPGILLRLPYGPDTDPVRTFAFDEAVEGKDHGKYLWGNPAMALACVVTRSFASDGWQMEPHRYGTLSGLPVHAYEEEGEQLIKPCAETLMRETMVAQLAAAGFIPFVTIKNTDQVKIWTLHSLTRKRLFAG